MGGDHSVPLAVGDLVRLRRAHPCGSYEWYVVRLGADIGLVCQGCRHRVVLSRGTLARRLQAVIPRADVEDVGPGP